MKKNILFLFSVFFLNLSSQIPSISNLELNRSNISLIASTVLPSKDIEGSIYMNPNFETGRAVGSSVLHKIRYNALIDELEISKDGKNYKLNKTFDFPIEFVDSNEVISFLKYNQDNMKVEGYLFEVGKSEHFTIYKKVKTLFRAEKVAQTPFDTAYPPEYKRIADLYFIQKDKGEINELPEFKNGIIKIFGDKKEEINRNFNGRKIDLSSKQEIVKLLKIL